MTFDDDGPSHWNDLSLADRIWLIAFELELRGIPRRLVLALRVLAERIE